VNPSVCDRSPSSRVGAVGPGCPASRSHACRGPPPIDNGTSSLRCLFRVGGWSYSLRIWMPDQRPFHWDWRAIYRSKRPPGRPSESLLRWAHVRWARRSRWNEPVRNCSAHSRQSVTDSTHHGEPSYHLDIRPQTAPQTQGTVTILSLRTCGMRNRLECKIVQWRPTSMRSYMGRLGAQRNPVFLIGGNV
jgi:hypothetical protein